MIRICINKENNLLRKITFIGHADYADYGKDIVCAAVSSTMLCTDNAIYSINDKSIINIFVIIVYLYFVKNLLFFHLFFLNFKYER